MNVTNDQLMAYADGELDAVDAARVAAMIARDPALAEVVARHQALRRQLQEAFAPALDEPLPAGLLATLREPQPVTGNVMPLAPRREAANRPRWSLPQWAAIAAALVLGLTVSRWGPGPEASLFANSDDGALMAGSRLSGTLERQLSAEAGVGGVAIGISFRARDGGYCRSFVTQTAQPLAGLACRRADGGWQVPALMEAAPPLGGDLRQASSPMPPALLAELDARIAGEPLDAAQEQAARDARWR